MSKQNGTLVSYINAMIDDVFVFSSYLHMNADEISNCIVTGKKIHNPLRVDKKPSAVFRYGKDNKLRLKDYAKPEYGGDIIDVVGIVLGYNVNTSAGFIQTAEHIIDNLIRNKANYDKYKPCRVAVKERFVEEHTDSFTSITVEYSTWNNTTFRYWFDFIRPNKVLAKLLLRQLQHWDIYPIEKYWLRNNIRASKIAKPSEPIYAYRLGEENTNILYKLYLPKSKIKFVTNAKDTLNYIDRVADTRFGVLTKSIKDAVFLNIVARYLKIEDVSFIAINSESSLIKTDDVTRLHKKFDKVFTLYDWDFTGISNAYTNALAYNIEPIFITNNLYNPFEEKVKDITIVNNRIGKLIDFTPDVKNYLEFIKIYSRKAYIHTKDYSDYMLKYGIDKAIKLFSLYYEAIKEREDEETNQLL